MTKEKSKKSEDTIDRGPMSTYEFLKNVDLFADMAEEDLLELCGSVKEMLLPAGEMLVKEGDVGDKAYIVMDGLLEITKHSSGREVLLAVRGVGVVIGEMALLEEAPRMASVRARTDTTLIIIHKETLSELLRHSPSAARAMLQTVMDRYRNTQAQLRQSEQMAQLGTLTAGIAHELNNPAAAVRRGAEQMKEALMPLAETQATLSRHNFSNEQQVTIDELVAMAETRAPEDCTLDILARSNREEELEDWLDDNGVEEAWDLAASLTDFDFSPEKLDELSEDFGVDELGDILQYIVAIYQAFSLLREIGQGAGRISEIVKALKSYAYLDQSPVQTVDIHEGINNTLIILRHKLKQGIDVERSYDPDLPKIQGYGSELNQVWTNIIDNAIDALDGEGTITIDTRHDENHVIVEIQDNGPGIPDEIRSRIFNAFFTTKPPGKGTGLGLNISYNIVVYKHNGNIRVFSEPGFTCFQIWLPLNFEQAEPTAEIEPALYERNH
jgi:signal transduction histidine kinase